jgi:hypothetical protein
MPNYAKRLALHFDQAEDRFSPTVRPPLYLSSVQGMVKLSGLWEDDGMKRPELTDVDWLGPRDEMDRASHRFGKCSECHETICVEKAVTDGPSNWQKTNETLYEAFRTHVKLKHSEEFNLAAIPATERHEA